MEVRDHGFRRNGRIHRAIKIGQEIAEPERGEDRQEERRQGRMEWERTSSPHASSGSWSMHPHQSLGRART
jgi:hypothetical protein